jgi:hypothetical protein
MRALALRSITVAVSCGFVLIARPHLARGDDAPSSDTTPTAQTPADPTVLEARREFVEGTALVRAERWGEALAAFERAAKLKGHAITTYNIAQCERAMGQFTRARQALVASLAQSEASGRRELPESFEGDARVMLGEMNRILPRVTVTLEPSDASITVDGRPLEPVAEPSSSLPVFLAGTVAPGRGASPGAVTFQLVANPGAHVITVSRQGYQDVVLTRTFAPSSTSTLGLELDKLPATIHVASNLADAIVRVNDADVGNPPVDVSRTAGSYRVHVARKGFVSYETEVTVRPGERVDLNAGLREERPALTQRWWFWAGVGVIVVGAATATYFATRSSADPQRPATDGGGLGWSLQVP